MRGACLMGSVVFALRCVNAAGEMPLGNVVPSAARHWSFQAPRERPVPVVKDTQWPLNAVDAFILAGLEHEELSPSPPADKRTLIRRATYDLTGLPPTPAETDAFVRDESPEAFARVVDRLLASPRYGERWGRHWLDVARYADTTGPRLGRIPFSYTYRDWVIRAFNEDLPYDAFLLKQLAADKLPGARSEDLAALGFLTVGRKSNRDTIHDIIDDWIDVVSRGTMGLSVNCARCHDHKFDPVSTQDYYALYGVFLNTQARQDLPVIGSGPGNEIDRRYDKQIAAQQDALLKYKQKRLAEITADLRKPARIAAYLLAAAGIRPGAPGSGGGGGEDEEINPFVLRRWRALLDRAAEKRDPYWQPWLSLTSLPGQAEKAMALGDRYASELAAADSPAPHTDPNKEALRRVLRGSEAPTDISLDNYAEVQNPASDQEKLENTAMLVNALGARYADAGGQPRAMAVEDAPVLRPAHVFLRGNPESIGEEVPRHFLTVLEGGKPAPFTEGSGRLELARRIANADNPLTARVMVNRVWQHHFGAGLVRTPSDFGTRGDAPTHPELLDFLARQFVADGWSLKKLHRLLMLSRTWQQASTDNPSCRNVDPENRLLWRMNRQRMDFESFRDSVLAVSGQLDPTAGGPPVPLFAQPSMRRRTVYGLIDRAQLPAALRSFDFANPEQHSPQRYLTTVPQQALFLMNDPFMAEQAQAFATRREVAEEQSPAARIQVMHRLVLGRSATDDEQLLALHFMAKQPEGSDQSPPPQTTPWQYGFGNYDAKSGKLESFQPFRVFVAANQQMTLLASTFPVFTEVWQAGNMLPDAKAGFANLSASGGEPGGPGYAVVRRWVAPADGTAQITGNVSHKVSGEFSDGIRAWVVSSRAGQLGSWPVANKTADANVKDVQVKAGDTIDFIVDCGTTAFGDEFTWAPVITLAGGDRDRNKHGTVSDASKEFRGPPAVMLTPWEQFALVLLQSNEFVFVD